MQHRNLTAEDMESTEQCFFVFLRDLCDLCGDEIMSDLEFLLRSLEM